MQKILLILLCTFIIVCCRNDEMIDEKTQNQEIELKTNTPTFISQIQVDFEGEIIKTNDEEIILYGMLIGENENLTINTNEGNQTKEYSNGTKIFKGSFFDLTSDKKYFLRFYVKTSTKIYYGNTVEFRSKFDNSPPEQNIVLKNQQEVIDFGKKNYTYVYNLTISGSVEDLTPLSSILKVGYNLTINDTTKLLSLKGLEGLKIVGTSVFPTGGVFISNNQKLNALTGLDELIFTGKLNIYQNTLLQNLQGLQKLTQVWHNTALDIPSFDGLPLNFRTGEFKSVNFQGENIGNRIINCEAYDFSLVNAPNITSLKGFVVGNYQNTTTFTIDNCKSLKTLEGISFPSKYDDIQIRNCENLENFKGLENLSTVNDILLNNLPKIKNFSGLENLNKVDYVFSLENVGMTNFSGLTKLNQISNFRIYRCHSLFNFEGLNSLTKIGNEIMYFDVFDCPSLEDFKGLEKVQHFTRFNVQYLPKLKNFEGVKSAKMPYMMITNCNLITSLEGLQNVSGVINIAIYQNKNLQNYCAIKNVVGNINSSSYYINGNLSNPSQQQIINNCP